jgi:hypothetical protein
MSNLLNKIKKLCTLNYKKTTEEVLHCLTREEVRGLRVGDSLIKVRTDKTIGAIFEHNIYKYPRIDIISTHEVVHICYYKTGGVQEIYLSGIKHCIAGLLEMQYALMPKESKVDELILSEEKDIRNKLVEVLREKVDDVNILLDRCEYKGLDVVSQYTPQGGFLIQSIEYKEKL